MYGTVARIQVKPDRYGELLAILREDQRAIDGWVASYAYRLDADPNRLMLAVVFRDKKSYMANADDPETDKWYRRFRETLAADPEWNDGEIVAPTGVS